MVSKLAVALAIGGSLTVFGGGLVYMDYSSNQAAAGLGAIGALGIILSGVVNSRHMYGDSGEESSLATIKPQQIISYDPSSYLPYQCHSPHDPLGVISITNPERAGKLYKQKLDSEDRIQREQYRSQVKLGELAAITSITNTALQTRREKDVAFKVRIKKSIFRDRYLGAEVSIHENSK